MTRGGLLLDALPRPVSCRLAARYEVRLTFEPLVHFGLWYTIQVPFVSD